MTAFIFSSRIDVEVERTASTTLNKIFVVKRTTVKEGASALPN